MYGNMNGFGFHQNHPFSQMASPFGQPPQNAIDPAQQQQIEE
jgi:hypothetical protein